MKKLFLLLFSTFILASCGTGVYEIAATGKPYEIFVVAPNELWKGATGDTLRQIMSREVEWINQYEPIFDLFAMPTHALSDMTRRHRNLLIMNLNPAQDSVSLTSEEDKYSTGQVIITLTAPSDSAAANYLSTNGEALVSWLELLERDRMTLRGKKYSDKNLTELIQKKFGFTMYIPTGYRVRKDTTNFLWISYEMPLSSQGLAIYTYPRLGGKLDILAERNLAVAQIPGPSDGSYMTTDTTFRPEITGYKINGRDWNETRGFWNVKNDFMGGPFINYVTYDTLNNRYIAIDMYVLSPSVKYPKRNYIRQLESLMMNVKID